MSAQDTENQLGGAEPGVEPSPIAISDLHSSLKADAIKFIKDVEAAGFDVYNIIGAALVDIEEKV